MRRQITLRDAKVVGKALSRIARRLELAHLRLALDRMELEQRMALLQQAQAGKAGVRGHVAAYGDEKTMAKPDWLLVELREASTELQALLDVLAAPQ